MGKIVVLDEGTSNKIAAGEVIERPASVVKELVENSIDASAGSITVEIKNGGISFIKVSDTGSGIAEDDAVISFERHATSKIRRPEDLESISTMGFRGEALASIAAVSDVELTTKTADCAHGVYVSVHGGTISEVRQAGCPTGTTFVIRNLFYNTPARYKFLKKDSTEAGYVSDVISRIALGNPHISFRLISGGTTVIHTPGNNDLLSVIFSLYGKDTARESVPVSYKDSHLTIGGYAGKPEVSRSNRNHQSIYINHRYIKSRLITSAIEEAYKTMLLKNRYAFAVLDININPILVDVNVHPTKMEVRFSDEQEIFRAVYHAVGGAVLKGSAARNVLPGSGSIEPSDGEGFRFKQPPMGEVRYEQQKINFIPSSVKEPSASMPNKPTTAPQTALLHTDWLRQSPACNDVESLKKEKNNTNPTTISEMMVSAETKINTEQQQTQIEQIEFSDETVDTTETAGTNTSLVAEHDHEDMTSSGDINGKLSNSALIGQAFSTYIILQQEQELILIDQHAAHERILYEKLKNNYGKKDNMTQLLLSPVVIELTYQEVCFVEEKNDFFSGLGFTCENFGNNSIIIRSVPWMQDGVPVRELFEGLLDHMMSSWKPDISINADEALYTVACKAAVKANMKLDAKEIEGLLCEIEKLQNPYTCPHGRPVILSLTKYQLEKMFKRIV